MNTIERRDYKFDFNQNNIKNWNSNGENYTVFMNVLSVFFPLGERFFIETVRNFKPEIKDKKLLADIKGFIGQEAMHTREHIEYNKKLDTCGYDIKSKEKIISVLLNLLRKLPKDIQLSVTCSLEHLTATLADGVLNNPELVLGKDSVKEYKDAWLWHAVEEVEHRNVAFDVYMNQKGSFKQTKRLISHTLVNIIFWAIVGAFYLHIGIKTKSIFKGKDLLKSMTALFGIKNGVLRKKIPEFFTYYKLNFHPSNYHNNNLKDEIEYLRLGYEK